VRDSHRGLVWTAIPPVRSCAAIVARVTIIIPRKSSQHDASRRVGFAAWFGLRHDGARRLRRGRPPAAGSASSIGWSRQASLVAVARCRTGVLMRCMTHAHQLAPRCHVEPRLDRARGRVRGECHCEFFGCLAACVLWLKCVEREMVSRCSRRRTGL